MSRTLGVDGGLTGDYLGIGRGSFWMVLQWSCKVLGWFLNNFVSFRALVLVLPLVVHFCEILCF